MRYDISCNRELKSLHFDNLSNEIKRNYYDIECWNSEIVIIMTSWNCEKKNHNYEIKKEIIMTKNKIMR